jgi:hypothetical protein
MFIRLARVKEWGGGCGVVVGKQREEKQFQHNLNDAPGLVLPRLVKSEVDLAKLTCGNF